MKATLTLSGTYKGFTYTCVYRYGTDNVTVTVEKLIKGWSYPFGCMGTFSQTSPPTPKRLENLAAVFIGGRAGHEYDAAKEKKSKNVS